MNNPLVSVVIITRDRPKELQRCVESIQNNTYKNTEIIIFDNSSEASRKITQDFLSSLGFKSDTKYIESPPKGFAEMRQIAISNSGGEVIMSIDDDCVVERDAISQIVRRFMSDGRIGIVGGNITNIGFKGDNKFKGRGKIGVNGRYEVVRDPRNAEVFGSANMSIRRKAFNEVGGYDLFFSEGLEEADLTLRIKRRGYKFVYEPSARITHFHSPSRFRSKWHKLDLDILRLYLFFKHYMPDNFVGWFRFFKSELRMVVEDISQLILIYIFPSVKKNTKDRITVTQNKQNFLKHLKVPYNICLELSKVIIARIIIPYLIYEAYKSRDSEEKV